MPENNIYTNAPRINQQHNVLHRRKTPVRMLREVIDTALPFVGIVLIFCTVLFVKGIQAQIALTSVGILIIEAGVWKLANLLLPNERKFFALRHETDHFISLVRQLNTAAIALKEDDSPENVMAFEDVQGAMQQTVERMAEVAGKTDNELEHANRKPVSAGMRDAL